MVKITGTTNIPMSAKMYKFKDINPWMLAIAFTSIYIKDLRLVLDNSM